MSISKTNKIIIAITICAILTCLLYLPWKAEKKFSYGNTVSYHIGYAFIGNQPIYYTENDFINSSYGKNSSYDKNTNNIKGAFDDIAEKYGKDPKKEQIKEQGYKIYPAWVSSFIKIDYIQVLINIIICALVGCIMSLLVNILKR